ncbi:hypothetical protein GW17_00050626 [Ensete ventricosum]|nr:hypothetical protein GW17_00050626 [Ensete ventricosum]
MPVSVGAAGCHRIRTRSTTASEPSRPPPQQQLSPTRLDSPRSGPIDLLVLPRLATALSRARRREGTDLVCSN